jgi:ribosome maturation factor RimP
MVKTKVEQSIIDALEAEAPSHDVDIVDCEIVGATKAPTVRVRIERADGSALDLDAVTAQSGWIGDVVEGIDPFTGSYTLEVSTPGMARPLRRPRDFIRFVGENVELTSMAATGRRKFKGALASADETSVTLALEDGESATFSYDDIKKCMIKPTFDFSGSKEGK